jgi:hypothetical protein
MLKFLEKLIFSVIYAIMLPTRQDGYKKWKRLNPEREVAKTDF